MVDAVVPPGCRACRSAGTTTRRSRPRRGARDFGPRSADDVYIIYTGGTTGQPKGVMWRHEDIWRTLGGGIDFITGERLEDEWAQSRAGAGDDGMVRMAPAPLIHGAAMVATLACLFAGDTAVIMPKFDPHAVWAAVQRHQVNVLSDHRRRDGPAADGGAGRRRLRHVLAGVAQLHGRAVLARGQGGVHEGAAQRVHQRGDRLDRDRLRRHRVRQRGRRAAGRSHGHGRARTSS